MKETKTYLWFLHQDAMRHAEREGHDYCHYLDGYGRAVPIPFTITSYRPEKKNEERPHP